jgi:hypothetical protein
MAFRMALDWESMHSMRFVNLCVLCVLDLFSAVGGPRCRHTTASVSRTWPSMKPMRGGSPPGTERWCPAGAVFHEIICMYVTHSSTIGSTSKFCGSCCIWKKCHLRVCVCAFRRVSGQGRHDGLSDPWITREWKLKMPNKAQRNLEIEPKPQNGATIDIVLVYEQKKCCSEREFPTIRLLVKKTETTRYKYHVQRRSNHTASARRHCALRDSAGVWTL